MEADWPKKCCCHPLQTCAAGLLRSCVQRAITHALRGYSLPGVAIPEVLFPRAPTLFPGQNHVSRALVSSDEHLVAVEAKFGRRTPCTTACPPLLNSLAVLSRIATPLSNNRGGFPARPSPEPSSDIKSAATRVFRLHASSRCNRVESGHQHRRIPFAPRAHFKGTLFHGHFLHRAQYFLH